MKYIVIDSPPGAATALVVHMGNELKLAREIARKYHAQNPASVVVVVETAKVLTAEMADSEERRETRRNDSNS